MRRILVASDFSLAPDLAFERGCELASADCADLRVLQLLLDRPLPVEPPGAVIEALLASARERHPCIAGMTHSVGAPSAAAIVAEAERIGADLIVMRNEINAALHDDRPFDLIERVLHRTDIPVLAVSQRCSGPYRRLLAMIDSGRAAQAVLETAETIRSAQTIFAVHACDDGRSAPASQRRRGDDPADLARFAVRQHRRDHPEAATEIRPITADGDVATVLVHEWSDLHPDLIVAVTRGRKGLTALCGHSEVGEILEDLPFDILARRLSATHLDPSLPRTAD